MAETILFTDVGEGIHEGKLVKWLVAEGQAIQEDQPLCEIETDKAVVEIPSSKTGTVLRLHGQVGELMHVGNPLVTVGTPGEKLSEAKEAAGGSSLSASVPAPSSSSAALSQPASTRSSSISTGIPASWAPTPSSASPKATPAVRKLAQQLGVDLSRVSGTGPGGLITESDVKNAQSGSASASLASASRPSTAPSPLPASSRPSMGPALQAPVHPALVKATPSVRKLAFQLGVDLTRVFPTGPQGHVTETDVRNAKNPSVAAATALPAPSMPSDSSTPAPASQRRIRVVSRPGGTDIRKPFSAVRKVIAERLFWSAAIPTVTHVDEADVTELWKIREREKARVDEHGVKLTLLPFVVKAVAKALQEFPDFNASLDEDRNEVVLRKYYDIGIAVDTPAGLMVPVLKDAERMSVFDIAKQTQLLATKTKERSLKADEMSGSTFTITNIGSAGGIYATPLINPPEAAILGVMRMQTRPAFAPDSPKGDAKNTFNANAAKKTVPKIEARQFLPLCLTFDHRLNDGAAAAAFVLEIRKHLENPEGLLVGDI